MKTTGETLQGVIDGRCSCARCRERTENIYRQVSGKCRNCGAGPFLILYREGDPAAAQDCPRCKAGYKPVSAVRAATDDEIPVAALSAPPGSSPTGETPKRESDWIALSLASHKAHATLTDAMKADGSALPEAVQLLAISADRALVHFERLRGDREDSDLMWALRRGLKEVRRELEAALSAPSSQATPPPQITALIERMRCEQSRWQYGHGCALVVSANSVDDWADELEQLAAPSASPAPSGRRHEEKDTTRSPSPDVIQATGSSPRTTPPKGSQQ